MVSIQTNQRKEYTMQRFFALLLAAVLLTACRPVTPATPAPTPSPTPDPVTAFVVAYAEFASNFDAVKAQMDHHRFDDPNWRAETALMAAEWRRAILAILALPVPAGSVYATAWPQYQQAMSEFLYAAGAIENAVAAGDEALLIGVDVHIVTAANYLAEAQRIVRGE